MSEAVDRLLSRVPLLKGLNPREMKVLREHLRPRQLAPGQLLFNEGDPGRGCFVVLSGRIGVYKKLRDGKAERLAVLTPGALVGHMALIDNKPRSAACRAEDTAVVLVELQRAEFDQLFNAHSPFAFKIVDRISTDLTERLRAATERLTEAHRTQDTRQRRALAQAAAEAVNGQAGVVDLDDIDLDSITVEVTTDFSRRMRTPIG